MNFYFQINFSCSNGLSVDTHIHVHQHNSVQKCVRYGEKPKYILQMFFDTNKTSQVHFTESILTLNGTPYIWGSKWPEHETRYISEKNNCKKSEKCILRALKHLQSFVFTNIFFRNFFASLLGQNWSALRGSNKYMNKINTHKSDVQTQALGWMAAVGRVFRRRSSATGRLLSWKKSNPVIHSTSLTRDWCIHRRGSAHWDSGWPSCTQTEVSCERSGSCVCTLHCYINWASVYRKPHCTLSSRKQNTEAAETRTMRDDLCSVDKHHGTHLHRRHNPVIFTCIYIVFNSTHRFKAASWKIVTLMFLESKLSAHFVVILTIIKSMWIKGFGLNA